MTIQMVCLATEVTIRVGAPAYGSDSAAAVDPVSPAGFYSNKLTDKGTLLSVNVVSNTTEKSFSDSPARAFPVVLEESPVSGIADSLLLRLLSLVPSGIGIVFLHDFGDNTGLFSEIFLIYDSIATDDEGHYAGRPIFGWISHESEPFGHLTPYDVALRTARSIFPLQRQHTEVITAVRG
jgi:hypothetical protein